MRRVWPIRPVVVQVVLCLAATSGALAEPAGTSVTDQWRPGQSGVRFDGRGRRLVVAWNDSTSGSGMVRAMSAQPPWEFQTPPLQIGRDSVVRTAARRV